MIRAWMVLLACMTLAVTGSSAAASEPPTVSDLIDAHRGDEFPPGGMDARVLALRVLGDDLYAGGEFTAIGPVPAHHVARYDGTTWHTLGTGTDGAVTAFGARLGDLVVGGAFQVAGGDTAYSAARWDGTRWHSLGQGPSAAPSAFARDYDRIIAGGSFTRRGQAGCEWSYHDDGSLDDWECDPFAGPRLPFVAAWSEGEWDAEGPIPNPYGRNGSLNTFPRGFVRFRGDLLAFGDFFVESERLVNGQRVTVPAEHCGLARRTGAGWEYVGPPQASADYHVFPHVRAALVAGDSLILAGMSLTGRAGPADHIAAWDGATLRPLGDGFDKAPSAGDGLASHLARWDGAAWHPVQGGTDGPVLALAVYHDRLIVAGLFAEAGGRPARNVAAFDGSGWATLGSGVDGIVNGLTVVGNDLYLGGDFREAGGKGADQVARWTDGPAEPALVNPAASRVPGGARIQAVAGYLPVDHRDFRVWRESYGEPRTLVAAEPVTGTVLDVTDPAPPAAAAAYWIEERGREGRSTFLGPVSLAPPAGLALTLAQNRPNPFAGSTRIAYRVPVAGAVDLAVFDVAGRRVAALIHDQVPPGAYEASWDGHDGDGRPAANGIYFYRLRTPAGTLTRKLVKTE